ncbi:MULTISPECIES: hypothetical protein [unclassified Cupriavidus]|uniref:hypothetical protein n=1 Tax=unclassified Cupriavidus TaxID=2640874 RepID=UPI001484E716|nr:MULTISPECIES: hypothetical protein [unclassified Cupriavidus]
MTEATRTFAPARPLGLLAALLLCTVLTACGGDNDNGTPTTAPTTTPEAKPQGVKCAP